MQCTPALLSDKDVVACSCLVATMSREPENLSYTMSLVLVWHLPDLFHCYLQHFAEMLSDVDTWPYTEGRFKNY